MRKSYSINGVVYNFIDVHEECGMLIGKCITKPHYGQFAWLDSDGVQFFCENRVYAVEVAPSNTDCTYMLWGGQLRDRLPHGMRYYMTGRR